MQFLTKLVKLFFYGNYYVGICAVALCIETNVQHGIALNGLVFYTLVLLAISSYYTRIYLRELDKKVADERIVFYHSNKKLVSGFYRFSIIACILLASHLLFTYLNAFFKLTNIQWGLILIFPLAAIAYTFRVLPFAHLKKLRTIGWAKPFILGFIWSGTVTVYPVIFYQIQLDYTAAWLALPSGWLWLKNWMFISILGIMFDIKDYEADKRNSLRTYPVMLGINNTVRFVIVPLVIAGLFSFFLFTLSKDFPLMRIAFNALPYLLLIVSAYSLQQKRPFIYYLAFIDGIMILKAICGVLGAELIKT